MTLNAIDRFEIFEQLNLHQRCIDHDGSLDSVHKYLDLYWPNAKFTVNDLRTADFIGEEQIKSMYYFAHSVFPLDNWKHSLGAFQIEGEDNTATVKWSWIVSWRKGGKVLFPLENTMINLRSVMVFGNVWNVSLQLILIGQTFYSSLIWTNRQKPSSPRNLFWLNLKFGYDHNKQQSDLHEYNFG